MLQVVKIGGNVIEDEKQLSQFLNLFSKLKGPKILVHGGGKRATALLKKLGIEPRMHQGRRITDQDTLEVATMVYGGLVNKKMVAQLQALGVNAIGLSGADANSILAHKRPIKEVDYGFAGDVDTVQHETLAQLLELKLTPVFCALTHDGNGQLLNTNADTIAAELAIGLSHHHDVCLNYCFELTGVLRDLNDPDSLIPKVNNTTYDALQKEGIIAEGMLPKMKNCYHALNNGVKQVKIGNLNLLDQNQKIFTEITL